MSKTMFTTKDVTTPQSGLVVYKNRYWNCIDGDPTKALFYGNSPQCNGDIKVQQWMIKTDLYKGMNVKPVFIETAYVPQRD